MESFGHEQATVRDGSSTKKYSYSMCISAALGALECCSTSMLKIATEATHVAGSAEVEGRSVRRCQSPRTDQRSRMMSARVVLGGGSHCNSGCHRPVPLHQKKRE